MPQREKRRKRKACENSEGASARAGGRSKLERWTVPQRRGKGEREEEPHALIYALRDLPRASLTHVRVYANAPHGATRRRPTDYTRHRGKKVE